MNQLHNLSAADHKRTKRVINEVELEAAVPNLLETLNAILPLSLSISPDSGLPTSGFSREAHTLVDETNLIFHLQEAHDDRTMIDVGAHFGGSALEFANEGWRVICHELDSENRKKLVLLLGGRKNVTIDPRAVSDHSATHKPYFASDVSTGISGLLDFHDSHKQVGFVDVTTVANILEENKLDHIHFLKIDVEGYDFSVLKGVPWDKVQPDFIECEFEDSKTKHLGHTWRDIAEYLVARGYSVLISEWHPIIQYGIPHDWHALKRYPCELENDDAWGNILAFKKDPGDAAIINGLNKALKAKLPSARPGQSEKPVSPGPNIIGKPLKQKSRMTYYLNVARWSYSRFAEWLKSKSLTLFRICQFVMWSVRTVVRHPLVFGFGAAVFAGLILGPGYAPLSPYAEHFQTALAIFSVIALAAMGVAFGNRMMSRFADRELLARQRLKAELQREMGPKFNDIGLKFEEIGSKFEEMKTLVEDGFTQGAKDREKLSNLIDHLRSDAEKTEQIIGTLAGDLQSNIGALSGELKSNSEMLVRQIRALDQDLDSRNRDFKARVSELKGHFDDRDRAHAQSTEKITKELEQLDKHQENMSSELKISSEELAQNIDRLGASANVFNFGEFQSFNRKLSNEHVELLLTKWAKKLKLELTQKSLFYLAHRICALENTLHGRLAAPIEDALLRVLVAASVKKDKLNVLEIGSLFGVGLAMLHDHTRYRYKSVHFTAIDPLEGYYEKSVLDALTQEPIDEKIWRDNLTTAGMPESDFTLIKKLSTDDGAVKAIGKSTFDVLIIDGDHSYEVVKSDFMRFGPFVKRGGYIIFDDYGKPDHPDVKAFVDSEVVENPDVTLVGQDWYTAVFRVSRKMAARK